MAIAKAHPSLTCIIQDLPAMVTPDVEASIPSELKCRVSFKAHDFFTPQTTQADVYFFRWVMHNWSDKYVLQILRNLIPALKPGSRVLVNEGMLPEQGSVGGFQMKSARYAEWPSDRIEARRD